MTGPKLKLCGLHSLEDVMTVSRSGADTAGFVMAESRRRVFPEDVKSWLEACPLPGKNIAALFVNAAAADIDHAVKVLNPDIIQCHGTETPQDLKQIKGAFGKEIWKAVPHDEEAPAKMEEYIGVCDGFVVDAKVKGAWGGTGQRFDWAHVPQYVSFGRRHNIPVLIAGGVTPENVEDLVRFHPWGVDVSSGIETKGKKDGALVTELEKRLNRNEKHVSG
ncbi:phosphoribosylanthranilate isomerase [Salibacterium sp. K-3]